MSFLGAFDPIEILLNCQLGKIIFSSKYMYQFSVCGLLPWFTKCWFIYLVFCFLLSRFSKFCLLFWSLFLSFTFCTPVNCSHLVSLYSRRHTIKRKAVLCSVKRLHFVFCFQALLAKKMQCFLKSEKVKPCYFFFYFLGTLVQGLPVSMYMLT